MKTLAIVGLGYVGLPLAVAFSKHFPVIGFDANAQKVKELQDGIDRTGEVKTLAQAKIQYTHDPAELKQADVVIVAVPTPITKDFKPDLAMVESASAIVGNNLKRGAIVCYESTVYPGVTEELCQPILEKHSGMKANKDFFLGYSPERINPGDKEHTVDKVIKVVSGSTPIVAKKLAELYGKVITAGIHIAPSIKTAEAAKVIENIQRDLNIALMNELSLIFERMGLDTHEVLEAASTKWNFQRFTPGLVGGHCIGVDPYYLTYKAQQLGYTPKVILAGRDINNAMAGIVADRVMALLNQAGIPLSSARVAVFGLTFKENVPDSRNSKAKELIEALQAKKIEVIGCDPLLTSQEARREFHVDNTPLRDIKDMDALVIVSPHRHFLSATVQQWAARCRGTPIIFDVKGAMPELSKSPMIYRRL